MIQKHTHTWLGAVGTLVAASTVTYWYGGIGVLTGLGIALSWYTLPSVYAFTIGQFALTAVAAGSGTPPLQLGLLEAGLLGILVEPAIYEGRQLRLVVLTGLGISVVMSLVWGLAEWIQPLWKTVVALTVSVALVAYGLHRYEQLELGLVTEVQ